MTGRIPPTGAAGFSSYSEAELEHVKQVLTVPFAAVRMGQPKVIAKAVHFPAFGDSGFTTGSERFVDGGRARVRPPISTSPAATLDLTEISWDRSLTNRQSRGVGMGHGNCYGRREVLRTITAGSFFGHRAVWANDQQPAKDLPEQIVDTMNAIFGKHPGFRAFHAKGLVCEGGFIPSVSAATLSRAPHLQERPLRATFRFSDGTGIPDVPDGASVANPHGLAVRIHLPDGASTDIVTNAFNGFPVATGEDFLAFFRALAETGPDAPKPTPLDKFLSTHPKAMKVVTAPKPTPVSFATEPYFGVHAFRFTNREGKARYGRYQIRPEAGASFLNNEEAAKKPPSFLIDELRDRLAKGPARFRLFVQLAAEGDPIDDSTAVWPEDRPTVDLGLLTVIKPAVDNDAAQRALGYDPMRLVDGIEASDDPLLELRSAVYAVSRRRRR